MISAYCYACGHSRAITGLRTCSEYAEPPGIALTGTCSNCHLSVSLVVSPSKYDELARARKVRDERGKASR